MTKPYKKRLPPAPAAAKSKTAFITGMALILITLAVYSRVVGFEFINYDDDEYVTSNPVVQSGFAVSGIKWAFVTGHAANWHPLTWLSHMLDCQLFGLRAGWHHFTSALLHAINAGLLFLWLRRLTGAFWRCAIAAGLWALHPQHVESVAWISERKDVLSAFFGLLSLIFYTRHAQGRLTQKAKLTTQNYLLALLFFAFGLMSKPMLVTFPFVMLLLDYWPLDRLKLSTVKSRLSILLLEKLPFFALAAVSAVVTFLVQQRGQAVQSLEHFPLAQRLGNAVISYARYLEQTFWPFSLANPYPHPGQWPVGVLLVAGGVLVGVSLFAWRFRRTSPFLLMGWLWFVGMLVPVIGLVQVGGQAMADRYVYLPHVGLFIAVVWGAGKAVSHPGIQNFKFKAGLTLAGVVLLGCGWRTVDQLGCWRNSAALFSHTLAVTKNNYVAWFSVGQYHDLHGDFPAAISHYQTALALKPHNLEILCNLGGVLIIQKNYAEGFRLIETALKLHPAASKVRLSLAASYLEVGRTAEAEALLDEVLRTRQEQVRAHTLKGRVFALRQDYERALTEYELALAIGRNHAEALSGKAFVFLQLGRFAEAAEWYEKVLRVSPTDAEARNQFGSALIQLNRLPEAVAQLQFALQSNPGLANARDNLGIALCLQGRLAEAVSQFREALRLAPGEASTHYNLANALAMQSAPAAAIVEYQAALRLDPAHVQAHCNLGVTLAGLGRRAEARAHLQEALRLNPASAAAREHLQQLDAPP